MSGIRNETKHVVYLLLAAALMTSAAISQNATQPATSTEAKPASNGSSQDAAVLSVTQVKTGLYMISGGGANTIVRLSASGPILVDGKLPDSSAALMKKIRRLSDLPVQMLILTDHQRSKTGSDARFGDAGVKILAQANAAQRIGGTDGGGKITAFDSEQKIALGGVPVELLHFGKARTDGDAVVYFPNLKVVAVGDLFATDALPDYASGGSLAGWSAALEKVLKLDFDTAVPSIGPAISKSELVAFKAKLDATSPDHKGASN